MNQSAEPQVVGKGALHPGESIRMLAVSDIAPDPSQPRTHFDEGKVAALAESMRADGLIQPIAVRAAMTEVTLDGETTERPWRIIAGERRWRAARSLGWEAISAVVRDLDDRAAAAAALIENTQREDLTVIELAHYLRKLIDTWGYTQTEVGKLIGKDRTRVSRTLAVLDLPDVLHPHLASGTLTAAHAELLAQLPVSQAARMGLEAASDAISVRELARRISASKASDASGRPKPARSVGDPDISALANTISEHLATKVAFRGRKSSPAGDLVIHYANNDVLQGILERLGIPLGDD